jgi:hypothetical protein
MFRQKADQLRTKSQKQPGLETPLRLCEEQLEMVAGGVAATLSVAGRPPGVGTTIGMPKVS